MAVQGDALEVLLRVIGIRTFQAQMYEARRSVAGLGTAAKESDAALGGTSKKLALLKKVGIGAAAILGVTAAESLKMSIEFEKQMTLVHTQAGASVSDMKFLTNEVHKLAHIMPQGPIQLAKAVYHMQSVFQNARTAAAGLGVAAKGAAIGNSDLEQTTTALAAATRAVYQDGHVGVGQFNHIMGVLNATIGAGNIRMDDLSLALGTAVVPAAKTAGLTLEDVGGAIALLADEGQRADNAATHLRMAFTLMGAGSKIAQKNLKRLGIDSIELGTKMHGPNGLVEALRLVKTQLEAKFPTFGPALSNVHNLHDAQQLARRFQVISKAFGGARSSATIMLLLNNFDQLSNKINYVYIHENKQSEAWAATQRTSAFKIHRAWSGLQDDMIKLGDTFKGPATSGLVFLLGAADQLVIGLTHLSTWVKHDQGAMVALAGAAGVFLLIWSLKKLVLVLQEARLAMLVFAVENPILAAFIALSFVAIMVVLHWKRVKAIFTDVWHWVKDHWWVVGDLLFGPFGLAAGLIAGKLDWIMGRLRAVLHWIQRAMAGVRDFLGLGGGGPTPTSVHSAAFVRRHSHATGIIGAPEGWARINETAAGEAVYLPGGSSVQPSPATSLRHTRAHTPNPTPMDDGMYYMQPVQVFLDSKKIYERVEKRRADKRARS